MALTLTQLQAIKADIAASEFSGLPQTSDSAVDIVTAYNVLAAPTHTVWRNGIATREILQSIVWSEYLTLSVAAKSTFQLMTASGLIHAGDANIRQGFQDVFSGAGQASTRAALVAMAKRSASRIEKLLASGAGSEANPSTMAFEGSLYFQDVLQAWNS